MSEKIKILEIIPSYTQSNGVSSFVYNYAKILDKRLFDVTVIAVRRRSNNDILRELKKNGIDARENYIDDGVKGFIKGFRELLLEKKIDIVHCNVPQFTAILFPIAKKNGVKLRISHAHGVKSSEVFAHRIINNVLIAIGSRYTTHRFACSEEAGKKIFRRKKFICISNAIDYDKYSFCDKKRAKIRKQMGIEHKIVIGHVGRYSKVKNQDYILDIAKEFKDDNEYVFMLIGGGTLESHLKERIENENLSGKVILGGCINNINEIYNAMDLFILPSIHEGMPLSAIEAQANGLNCILSNNISASVKISNGMHFLPVGKKCIKMWARNIKQTKKTRIAMSTLNRGYDIKTEISTLEKVFKKMVNEAYLNDGEK